MILIVLLQTIFAFSFITFKEALVYGPPFLSVAIRCFFAAIPLLAYQYYRDRTKVFFNEEVAWLVFASAFFNIYLTNAYEMWGMNFMTAGKAAFIYNLSPFMAILMSYLVFDQKLSKRKWIGFAIGFLGFLPILIKQSPSEMGLTHIGFLSKAEISVIVAALATAIGWVFTKKLVYHKGYTNAMTNGTGMLIAGFICLVQSYFVESWSFASGHFAPFFLYSVAGSILSFLIAYSFYIYLLKRYSNTLMSLGGYMGPFITAFLGWLFLGETVYWTFFLSGGLVLIGLLIFYKDEVTQWLH